MGMIRLHGAMAWIMMFAMIVEDLPGTCIMRPCVDRVVNMGTPEESHARHQKDSGHALTLYSLHHGRTLTPVATCVKSNGRATGWGAGVWQHRL